MRISDWSSDVCSSDLHQRSPTVREAMEALDIEDRHSAAVQYDFRKLRRADGLPFELRSVSDRRETTGLNLPYEIPVDQMDAGLRMRRIALSCLSKPEKLPNLRGLHACHHPHQRRESQPDTRGTFRSSSRPVRRRRCRPELAPAPRPPSPP